MKKKAFLIATLILFGSILRAQNKKIDDPTLAVYKLLTEQNIEIKDSLIIYSLNFELTISKVENRTIVTNISANDSLAFQLFPSYKRFSAINFTTLMGSKNKIKLLIPILIYGSSPEKMTHKDEEGNPLISLNAAVNAAYALYSPLKYDNERDAGVSLNHLLFKSSQDKKRDMQVREVMIMEPITIRIYTIR